MLIICYLCGLSRTVRSSAWGILCIGLLYIWWSLAFAVPSAYAATTDTSVVYDSISALQALEAHRSYEYLFEGNNWQIFDILKEHYRDGDNFESFDRFVTAFDTMSTKDWARYRVNKTNAMIVFSALDIIIDRRQGMVGSSGWEVSDAWYTIKTYSRDNWTLVTFDADSLNTLPKRMNWYFGDGTMYSCERSQCARFNHVYTTPWTYQVTVYKALWLRRSARVTFDISL